MSMKKIAVIRKCKPEDREEGKPYCLYTHDGKKLLGRHPSKESARKQEEAIKANSSKKIGKRFESILKYLRMVE